MFGVLLPSPARGGARKRVVLRLEDFEGRDQPSGLWGFAPTSSATIAPPANQRPVILNFSCREVSRGVFLVTGLVRDELPGGLTVTLGGSTSAAGLTTVTQSDGSFSMTVQLGVDGTDCGWITATVADAQGLVSNEVSQFVNPRL